MAPTTAAAYLKARQPLYGVLDAARDDGVRALLRRGRAEHASLYDGHAARVFAKVAPYLVRLEPDASLIESLTTTAWGQSWGVYLTCDRPFAEVRRHLRRFLQVSYQGETLTFRFYDPRVLRHFLPRCTADELATFFGPFESYLVETRDPAVLLRFTVAGGPTGERIALARRG
jgi:hypothetical protein